MTDWTTTADARPPEGMKVEVKIFPSDAATFVAWRFTGFPGWSPEREWFTEDDRGTRQLVVPPAMWRAKK